MAIATVGAILPNHTTLSYWPAVANGTVALFLLVVGVGMLDARRWAWAGATLVGAALCYEVALLPAAVAVVAVPGLRHRLRLRPTVGLLAGLSATGIWMALHPTYPLDDPLASPAHFGAGITSSGGFGLVLSAIAAEGLVAVAWAFLRRTRQDAEWLAFAGLVLIPVGLAAFARHEFHTLGTADRAYTVSSVGAAMVWVGIGAAAWARSRRLAVVAGVVFACLVVPANLDRQRAYARAGEDALALVEYVQARYGDAIPPVVVGPTARRFDGVSGTLGVCHASRLLQFHVGNESVQMRVATSAADFASVPVALRVTWEQVGAYRRGLPVPVLT